MFLMCVVVLLSSLVLCAFFALQYYFDFMCFNYLFIITVSACVLPWRINVFIITRAPVFSRQILPNSAAQSVKFCESK